MRTLSTQSRPYTQGNSSIAQALHLCVDPPPDLHAPRLPYVGCIAHGLKHDTQVRAQLQASDKHSVNTSIPVHAYWRRAQTQASCHIEACTRIPAAIPVSFTSLTLVCIGIVRTVKPGSKQYLIGNNESYRRLLARAPTIPHHRS